MKKVIVFLSVFTFMIVSCEKEELNEEINIVKDEPTTSNTQLIDKDEVEDPGTRGN